MSPLLSLSTFTTWLAAEGERFKARSETSARVGHRISPCPIRSATITTDRNSNYSKRPSTQQQPHTATQIVGKYPGYSIPYDTSIIFRIAIILTTCCRTCLDIIISIYAWHSSATYLKGSRTYKELHIGLVLCNWTKPNGSTLIADPLKNQVITN